MKKKVFNSILFFIVIFIWLFVFKKSFGFYDGGDKAANPVNNGGLEYISAIEFRKDTFAIQDYDRDPFLDTFRKRKVLKKKKAGNTKNLVKKTLKKEETSKLTWPKLQYFGYIRGGAETKKLALIKLDNKLLRIREKQSVNDIYILAVYKDSVVLRMDKENRTIRK